MITKTFNYLSKKDHYNIQKTNKHPYLIPLSKPSRKRYNIKHKLNQVYILRTSKGILNSLKSQQFNIKGELLFKLKT